MAWTGFLNNLTGDDLSLAADDLSWGSWDSEPPSTIPNNSYVTWTCEQDWLGKLTGSVTYQGSRGSIRVDWDLPLWGDPIYTATATGDFAPMRTDGDSSESGGVMYSVGLVPPPDVPIAPSHDNNVTLDFAGGLITSSNITVDGLDFPDWFNREFLHKPHGGLFPAGLKSANFHTVWDNLKVFTDKDALTVNEFVAHLMIMYNETGGSLASIAEVPQRGMGDAYFFEPGPLRGKDHKASYNGPIGGNRAAGDQLAGMSVISDPDDVAAWNSRSTYPSDQPDSVKLAARACDFYKYRGHGLNQLTFRGNYQRHADGPLNEVFGKTSEEMSSSELDAAFKDPGVYLRVFKNFNRGAVDALDEVISGSFARYGNLVAGGHIYGPTIFEPRCKAVAAAMFATGYTAA